MILYGSSLSPFVRHVLWTPYDEPMEGILVLFGDNSDAAFGRSYLDVQEGLHGFYGSFPFKPQETPPSKR